MEKFVGESLSPTRLSLQSSGYHEGHDRRQLRDMRGAGPFVSMQPIVVLQSDRIRCPLSPFNMSLHSGVVVHCPDVQQCDASQSWAPEHLS